MLLIVVVIISGGAMISHVNVQKGRKNFWFFNPLLIPDYMSITRKNAGRIGRLFWIFVIAVISLITFSIFGT